MVNIPQDAEKLYYTWEQFDSDTEEIARRVKASGREFTHIIGLARGGLPLAVCLSHRLDLEFATIDRFVRTQITSAKLTEVEHGVWTRKIVAPEKLLVVDDLTDLGKQLQSYKNDGFFIATLFYHRQSTVVPDIWIREKTDKWIVYPWEKAPL